MEVITREAAEGVNHYAVVKKRPKPKPSKRPVKTKRPTKPKTKKRKAVKAKKLNGSAVRSERLDMRLTKAEKAKISARAKRTRRTVTSLIIEAIEKIK